MTNGRRQLGRNKTSQPIVTSEERENKIKNTLISLEDSALRNPTGERRVNEN